MYYIYDTIEEVTAINNIICKGECIGDESSDITKKYADAIITDSGKCAIIADDITSKYIIDRSPTEITLALNNI
ncbi:hypothetical protein UFOVP129_19 [uncultured Caudovirales phage]|uniref:Uncharacterized protein n=1 Tax=uncultured Caudovirales phage TaxID=2100421 RepID=A0A6J5L7V3_9CAUD|nr:hypothetical protein UFOVP129_19 [uncultured Caudovirales phage]